MVSKMHQRVRERTAMKQRIASGDTSVPAAAAAAIEEVKPLPRPDELMTDDAELKKIMDELDRRGTPLPNTFWDEAQASHADIVKVLDDANEALGDRLEAFVKSGAHQKDLTAEQAGRLTVLVNQAGRDIENFSKELDETYALHKDKSGGVVDGDDTMLLLQVQDAYQAKAMLFNKLVVPVVDEINELIGVTHEAAAVMAGGPVKLSPEDEAKLIAMVSAQDPNVVTDAQIVEAAPQQG